MYLVLIACRGPLGWGMLPRVAQKGKFAVLHPRMVIAQSLASPRSAGAAGSWAVPVDDFGRDLVLRYAPTPLRSPAACPVRQSDSHRSESATDLPDGSHRLPVCGGCTALTAGRDVPAERQDVRRRMAQRCLDSTEAGDRAAALSSTRGHHSHPRLPFQPEKRPWALNFPSANRTPVRFVGL